MYIKVYILNFPLTSHTVIACFKHYDLSNKQKCGLDLEIACLWKLLIAIFFSATTRMVLFSANEGTLLNWKLAPLLDHIQGSPNNSLLFNKFKL